MKKLIKKLKYWYLYLLSAILFFLVLLIFRWLICTKVIWNRKILNSILQEYISTSRNLSFELYRYLENRALYLHRYIIDIEFITKSLVSYDNGIISKIRRYPLILKVCFYKSTLIKGVDTKICFVLSTAGTFYVSTPLIRVNL